MESHERKTARYLLTMLGCASLAMAQTGPPGPEKNGLHLYNVMTSVGYVAGRNDFLPFQAGASQADLMGTVSTTVGYTWRSARSNLAVTYMPSYARTRGAALRADSHNLSLSAGTQLSNKWSLSLSGMAVEMSLDQLLFAPTNLSQLADAPGTAQDLSGAVLGQNSASAQVASLVSGLSLADPLSRGAIYGDRLFNASLEAGLTYAYSTRLKVRFAGAASNTQTRPNADNTAVRRSALIPRSSTGEANAGVSYSLTPRTEIGASAATVRVFAGPADYFITRSMGSIGRQLTPHWFAALRAGVGVMTPLHQAAASTVKPSLTWEGNGGYTYGAHTFLGTVNRMVGDLYGFSAWSTTGVSGAWNWTRPARRWETSLTAGREQIRREADIVSWNATAAVSIRLNRETAVTFAGAYLDSSGALIGRADNLSGWSARVTFVWTPNGRWATVSR